MKPINARFSAIQLLSIKDVSEVTRSKPSEVARAAMYLGLQQIKELAARDTEKARELVAIADTKSKL